MKISPIFQFQFAYQNLCFPIFIARKKRNKLYFFFYSFSFVIVFHFPLSLLSADIPMHLRNVDIFFSITGYKVPYRLIRKSLISSIKAYRSRD